MLKGRVDTLSRRRGLKFILYNSIFDRPISCYLDEGEEERMRDIWGENVLVTGRIGRDRQTGYPLIIRNITDIKLLTQYPPDHYKQAAGIILWKEGQETGDQVIRRMRDAS